MRTWIRIAVAPALLGILWTTLPAECSAQGRGRGGGGGRGGMAVARSGGGGGRAVVSGNRAYVNSGNYSRGYYGGNRYGYGGYGYNGLGYGLAGFGLGYGLGSGLGYGGYGLGGYGYGGGIGSGYYGGNSYYGNSYYSNAAPVQTYQSLYPPSDNGGTIPDPVYFENGRGRIEVHVPANAQIFWNGAPSALTGPTRLYATVPLGPAGAQNTFEARWTDANGQVVSQTRTVQAMPNQSVTVDFNQPAVNQ